MTDLHAHPILEGDATSAWMGLHVELTEKDHAIVRMTVRDEMVMCECTPCDECAR